MFSFEMYLGKSDVPTSSKYEKHILEFLNILNMRDGMIEG